jgi:hypothetical protein
MKIIHSHIKKRKLMSSVSNQKTFANYKANIETSLSEIRKLATVSDSPHGKLLVDTIRAVFDGVEKKFFTFNTDFKKTVLSYLKEQSPNPILNEKIFLVSYWTEVFLEYLGEQGTVWPVWEVAGIRTIEILLFYYRKNMLDASMIKILFESMNENVIMNTAE